jgi:hypothetical protein
MAWPKIKKYGIVGVPILIGVVLTTLVVNNEDIRYKVEEILPGYGILSIYSILF